MKIKYEDSLTALDKAKEKYRNSILGKTAQKRYAQSKLGKEARKRYFESEKGKAALLRYYLSEKAETQRQKHRTLEKLFRLIVKYLKANPEATIEEALETLTNKNPCQREIKEKIR